jgi:hypothetical protein
VRIKARERHNDRAGIGVDSDFVGLADINQEIAPLRHAF